MGFLREVRGVHLRDGADIQGASCALVSGASTAREPGIFPRTRSCFHGDTLFTRAGGFFEAAFRECSPILLLWWHGPLQV